MSIRKISIHEETMEKQTKAHILVVDDEEDIRKLVQVSLQKEGYGVTSVENGEAALRTARLEHHDLILLDLMLPGEVDGLEVCKLLRNGKRTSQLPIIMLTAKGEESDIVIGLELGADDYITKPFSPKVLIARVKAALRRRRTTELKDEGPMIERGELFIHPDRHEVRVMGKTVKLTATEFRILTFLARHPGWVYTRSQIVDAARGDNYVVTDRSVDVHIVSLRKKLEPEGKWIETVRGVGYRFREE